MNIIGKMERIRVCVYVYMSIQVCVDESMMITIKIIIRIYMKNIL